MSHMGSCHLVQGLCCEVSQRSLHFKTLQEGAAVATGKRIIVYHQTMTNKPQAFPAWISGRRDSSNRILHHLCQLLSCFWGGQCFLFLSPPQSPRIPSQLANQGEESTHTDLSLPQSWRRQAVWKLWRSFLRLSLRPRCLAQDLRMRIEGKLQKAREGGGAMGMRPQMPSPEPWVWLKESKK